MYCLLNWSEDYNDLGLCYDQEGDVILVPTKEEAKREAKCYNGRTQIVLLEE